MRQRLFKDIALRLVALHPNRILKVAIDGVDGAGKTMFADELASFVAPHRPVIRASVDGFHNPRAVRYARGRHSPEGFFRDSYDYAALRKRLLDPLSGGNLHYTAAVFDSVIDSPVVSPERVTKPRSVLLFDGIFLHRPELRGYWDASIFLRVDFRVSAARGAIRDGTPADPSAQSNRRYIEGQRIYLSECDPEARATFVIDYNDLMRPLLITIR